MKKRIPNIIYILLVTMLVLSSSVFVTISDDDINYEPMGTPSVTTNATTNVEETTATLHGYLSDDGGGCNVKFQYGTTTGYGTNTANQSKSSGDEFSAGISSLSEGTLYHSRAVAITTGDVVLTNWDDEDVGNSSGTSGKIQFTNTNGASYWKVASNWSKTGSNSFLIDAIGGTSTPEGWWNLTESYDYMSEISLWFNFSTISAAGSEYYIYFKNSTGTTVLSFYIDAIAEDIFYFINDSAAVELESGINGDIRRLVVTHNTGNQMTYKLYNNAGGLVVSKTGYTTGNNTWVNFSSIFFDYTAEMAGQITMYLDDLNITAGTSTGYGSDKTFLTKPLVPTSFTATTYNTSQINLTWTKGTGADNTYIERNATAVTSWARGAGTEIYNGTGTNYEDTGLASGVTYYYQAWSYTDQLTLHQWSDSNASSSNTTETQSSDIVYVDDNAGAGWYDATHVKTIQEGIDNVSSSGTVYIWAGAYNESVTVNKSLTIIGNSTETVNLTYTGIGDGTVIISVDWVNISNINMHNISNTNAIYLQWTNHTNISSVSFVDITESIIEAGGESMGPVELYNLTIRNAGNGLILELIHNLSVIDCSIINVTKFGMCEESNSLYLSGITDAIITGCNISDSSTETSWGILSEGTSSNITFYNNYISNFTCLANDTTTNIIWNTTKQLGTNIIGGSYLGGNYWSEYTGIDTNGDGLGNTNTPYNSSGNITDGGDYLPLCTAQIATVKNLNTSEMFVTIQSAIDDSDTLNGHTIQVYAGTYNENVVINKTLTIQGNSSTNTTIDGGNVGSTVKITVDWVNLTGFYITNCVVSGATQYAGVKVIGNNTHIYSCNISSNNGHGVYVGVQNSDYYLNNISNNNISSNGEVGVYLSYTNSNAIYNNTIMNSDGRGIFLQDSSPWVYNYDNNISYNAISKSSNSGIEIKGGNHTVWNNTISDCTLSGIYLNKAENITVYNNNVTSNGGDVKGDDYYGLMLESSNNNTFYNNYVSNIDSSITYNVKEITCTYGNVWNTTKQSGSSIIGGSYLGGNYWSDYTGEDTDGDGLGNTLTPYNSSGNISNGGDYLPLCTTQEGIDVDVSPDTWTAGNINIGTSTTENFTFYQNGSVNIDITVGYDSTNYTFVVYSDWLTSGHDRFCANFTNDAWVSEHDVSTGYPPTSILKTNFAPGNFEFGIRMWMPRTTTNYPAKQENFDVVLTVQEHT